MRVLVAVLVGIVVVVVQLQLICFWIALHEAVNLPAVRHTRLTAPALAAALRGFVVETLGVVTFVLTLPLGYLPWRRVPRLAPGDHVPLIFVPGYAMNRACFLLLRWRLRRDGWSHAVGLNYRTVRGDLLAGARRLRDTVETLCAQSGAKQVSLIAHSMGGIVARVYLRDLGGAARVAEVITLGTPHQGSSLYALSLDPMVQQMREGSPFMQRLGEDDPVPAQVGITAIYSSFDVLVVPSSQAYYPRAANIEVEGVGHMGLLWSRRVYQLIRESLENGEAGQDVVPVDVERPAG